MAYTDIDDPEKYFQSKSYTGGSGDTAHTFDGTSDMQPDLVWIKNRTQTDNHAMIDSVRGSRKWIGSNVADQEDSNNSAYLASFNSDGFTTSDTDVVGKNGETYASWSWKEDATAGFDIVTYSGSAASSKTVSHNLSAVPKMILVKCRSASENWAVYHHALGNTHALFLNTTGTSSDTPVFADTTPTSSVFSVSADDRTGADGKTYVAYVFAEKQGYLKVGSYIGNGNADGTFIYTGFRPAFLIYKNTTTADSWFLHDNRRQGFNDQNELLFADSTQAESTVDRIRFTANGFKTLDSDKGVNKSGDTYVYMAIAEAPLVNSNGVPANAR